MKEGLALLLALVLARTTELSSHSAVAYLKKEKKKLLNQFLFPANDNLAFLISSFHTMLFIGIQGKHGGPALLRRTNWPLMQSRTC